MRNVWLNCSFSPPNWTVRSEEFVNVSLAYSLRACRATHVSWQTWKQRYYWVHSSQTSPFSWELGLREDHDSDSNENETNYRMSRRIAQHVRLKTLYIRSSVLTEQQHEITNFCVLLKQKSRQHFSHVVILNPALHSNDMPKMLHTQES